MVDVLSVAPFGAVIEIQSQSRYYCANGEYEVYLNGEFFAKSSANVVPLMGLTPGTYYDALVKGYFADDDMRFSFETPRPDYLIDVRRYGAKGDGSANDTAAVNMALYAAPKNSTVYFPAGEYVVSQLLLKSDVDLYIEKGAAIRQSADRRELAIIKGYERSYDHIDAEVNASWEGHPLDCYASLVYGKSVSRARIYGGGSLDGNGAAGGFWAEPQKKGAAYRPKNVLLVDCVDIRMMGLASGNGASWNIHLHGCDDVCLHGLDIAPGAPGGDGISPESCHAVEIVGCRLALGERGGDCVAVRSGKYYMSLKHRKPTRSVTVRNCLMESGGGAVTIGSEMSCGVYGVDVSQCLVRGTRRGLRVITRRGRGEHGIIDGITLQNCSLDGVRHCVVVNMFYNGDPDGHSDYVKDRAPRPADEFTPSVKNIWLSNVSAQGVAGSAVFVRGLPESRVSQLIVRDSVFAFAAERVNECPDMMDDCPAVENLGFYIENASEIIMAGNVAIGRCENYGNIRVRQWPSGDFYPGESGLECGVLFKEA